MIDHRKTDELKQAAAELEGESAETILSGRPRTSARG